MQERGIDSHCGQVKTRDVVTLIANFEVLVLILVLTLTLVLDISYQSSDMMKVGLVYVRG